MQYLLIINIFVFIYSSVYRRNIKRRFLLCGLVQDHHIIPREFKNILNYDNSNLINSIDSSKNLIILPTRYGKLFINTNRSIHENGHKHYNKYIYNLIITNNSIDYIIRYVKQQLRNGNIEKII
tara:strand:- start:822 stop:1193 length:372 start_codon:yes stop_codon:yes gene_type:complete